MKREYDFSKSVPNRHLKAVKKGIHIRLDQDVIEWLKAEALKQEIGYQTLANAFLRDKMQETLVVPDKPSKRKKSAASIDDIPETTKSRAPMAVFSGARVQFQRGSDRPRFYEALL